MPSDDQKPIKKTKVELDEAEDGISLGALLLERKKKLSNVGSKPLSKPKKEELHGGEDGVGKSPKMDSGSASKVKKQEQLNSFDEKPAKKSPAPKRDMELKKKKKVKEEEAKSKSSKGPLESQKRAKKVYDLPGQKRDPPEERDPLRIFYESLYKQLPHSEMAQFWMMESGLLSKEEAKKVFEKKQKKTLQKLSNPVKTVSAVKSVTKTAVVKKTVQSSPVSSSKTTTTTVNSKVVAKQTNKRKAKNKSSEDESDDDFIINRSLKKKPRAA